MKNGINMTILLIAIFLLVSISSYSYQYSKNDSPKPDGWSSIDNVFYKQEKDLMVKKSELEVIKIGFTSEEVQGIMGVPDRIDKEEYTYYYHHSPIYFGEDWRVKSWDNRYGNLKVLPEREEIRLGDHISKVFHEKGFPLRVKMEYNSYLLHYTDQLVYVNERWLVEAIQIKKPIEDNKVRAAMGLPEYIIEFETFLKE